MLKRGLLTAIMSLFLGFMPVALLTTPSHAEVIQHEFLPVSFTFFNPCALDGLGEDVAVTGELHLLQTITENDNNIILVRVEGITATGVGLTTGDPYQVKSVGLPDPAKISLQNGQGEFHTTSTLKIIGLGGSSNLIAQFVDHVTRNAQGEITVSFIVQSTKCV
jgi:hypothetical protein